MFKAAYAHITGGMIHALSMRECKGCRVMHGSQTHYMDAGGCLEAWPNKVAFYMERAMEVVSKEGAAELVRKMRAKLVLSPGLSELLPDNYPDVTEADVYRFMKMEQPEYTELMDFFTVKTLS